MLSRKNQLERSVGAFLLEKIMSEKIKIGETEFELPFRYDRTMDRIWDADGNPMCDFALVSEARAKTIAEALNRYFIPIDIITHCPKCNFQHVDKAEPDNCKNCGAVEHMHFLPPLGVCDNFEPWLNAPHEKHRCHSCGNVWKPANVPTNGVASIEENG